MHGSNFDVWSVSSSAGTIPQQCTRQAPDAQVESDKHSEPGNRRVVVLVEVEVVDVVLVLVLVLDEVLVLDDVDDVVLVVDDVVLLLVVEVDVEVDVVVLVVLVMVVVDSTAGGSYFKT